MNKEAIEEQLQCVRTQLNALRGTDENVIFFSGKNGVINGTVERLAAMLAMNAVRYESFAEILTGALFLYRNMPKAQRERILKIKVEDEVINTERC